MTVADDSVPSTGENGLVLYQPNNSLVGVQKIVDAGDPTNPAKDELPDGWYEPFSALDAPLGSITKDPVPANVPQHVMEAGTDNGGMTYGTSNGLSSLVASATSYDLSLTYNYTFFSGNAPTGAIFTPHLLHPWDTRRTDVEVSATLKAFDFVSTADGDPYTPPPMASFGFGVAARCRYRIEPYGSPGTSDPAGYVLVPEGVFFYPEVVDGKFTRWVITLREKWFEPPMVVAESTAGLPLSLDHWYTIMLRVEGNTATGIVDGAEVCSAVIGDTLTDGEFAGPCAYSQPALGPWHSHQNDTPPDVHSLYRNLLITTPHTTLVRQDFQPMTPSLHAGADGLENTSDNITSTAFGQSLTVLGSPFVTRPDNGTNGRRFERLGVSPTGAGTCAELVNVNTPDGWAFTCTAGRIYGITPDKTAGLVLRGNPDTQRALVVEPILSDIVHTVQSGYRTPNQFRTGALRLSILEADGVTRTKLAEGTYPDFPQQFLTNPWFPVPTSGTEISDGSPYSYMFGARCEGTRIQALAGPSSSVQVSHQPWTVIDYTLSGDLAVEFGDATLFGYFNAGALSTDTYTTGGFHDFSFVSLEPMDIPQEPGNLIIPDLPTVPSDAFTILLPDAGGAGWTYPDGYGFYVGYDRNIVTGTITPWVAILPPGGTTRIINYGTAYATGVPTDPLSVILRRIGNRLEILYNGRVIYFYDLTEDDLSGLSLSTDYISFLDATYNLSKPPRGTLIIGSKWVNVTKPLTLHLPYDSVPMGRTSPWKYRTIRSPYSLLVMPDNSVIVTQVPDPDLVENAKEFYPGGRGTYRLTSAQANVIGAAGYGNLLGE